MAKLEYLDPIKAVHGKLAKAHRTVYHGKSQINQYGVKTNYTSIYEKEYDPSKLTAAQQAAMARFGAICTLVNTRMHNAETLPADKVAWKASGKQTFRKYLWVVCANEYDATQG